MTSLFSVVLFAVLSSPLGQSKPSVPRPEQLIGTWRGTSLCTDLVAAPACHDETAVYEFTSGPKPGLVHWKADKIVNGRREPMGEADLSYDVPDACWKTQISGPRVTSVWRLSVNGTHLTGTARLLPGNQTIRKIDLQKDHP
jgi:hypothetical protein